MKSVILYGSRYGSARRYAQELSKQTDIPAVSYQEAPPLSKLETIVYIGALYAGGVLGLTKTLRRQSFGEHQRLVIVTVGLADPDILQNREDSRPAIWQSSGFPSAGRHRLSGAISGTSNHDGAAAPISAKEIGGRMERRRQGVNGNLRQAGGFCRFRFPAADCQ